MVNPNQIKISPEKMAALSEQVSRLSNRQRMTLKKIGRGGVETRSRARRSNRK